MIKQCLPSSLAISAIFRCTQLNNFPGNLRLSIICRLCMQSIGNLAQIGGENRSDRGGFASLPHQTSPAF